jgi:transposase
MDIVYTYCAGMDVHKKTIVVCCMTPDAAGSKQIETRTFGTMTQDLLALSDWLTNKQITHVAMESTGELWKPVHNILEGSFTVLLVNAQHIKNVPGRKTDVQDAEWIADLLRHGLVRGSFVPPLPQRDLRDLTRQRTLLVRERADVVNRLHKVLEWANIKLTSVATDVMGVSGRAMLEAIVAGQADPAALAELAKGRLRNKQKELVRALEGRTREHHRFLIAQHLIHIEFLDEQIALFDATITQQVAAQSEQSEQAAQPPAPLALTGAQMEEPRTETGPLSWDRAVVLLDTIPGVGLKTAQKLLAEIGADMSRFPTEAHLASWAKLCPGNNESAGKRHSGRTGKGNTWLRGALTEAAWAAVKVKDCYLAAIYHRLVGRRGPKKAIIAVAHHILIASYYMLKRDEPYQDHGPMRLDEQRKNRLAHRLRYRLEQLGYVVNIQEAVSATS